MWMFWDYCADNGNRWSHWPAEAAHSWGTWMLSTGFLQPHLNCSQEETSASAPLQNSLWVGVFECLTKSVGNNWLQYKMGADFFLRSLFSWEWRRSETLDVSISIHSAIPNNKGGSGRRKGGKNQPLWKKFELHLKAISPHFPWCITEPSPALWGIDNPTL